MALIINGERVEDEFARPELGIAAIDLVGPAAQEGGSPVPPLCGGGPAPLGSSSYTTKRGESERSRMGRNSVPTSSGLKIRVSICG